MASPVSFLRNIVARIVDARIASRLETEQKVVSELGKTFTQAATQLTDDIHTLRAAVREIQQRLDELEKKSS